MKVMATLTAKSSTIFIATDEGTRVYRSLDEVPPGLLRKLRTSTRGINSGTILIADKRGRQELERALQQVAKAVAAPAPKRRVSSSRGAWSWRACSWPMWMKRLFGSRP